MKTLKILTLGILVCIIAVFLWTGGIDGTQDYFSLRGQFGELKRFLPVLCPHDGFTAERDFIIHTESYMDCSVMNTENKMPEDFFNTTLKAFLSNGWSVERENRDHPAYEVMYYLSKVDNKNNYSLEWTLQKENHNVLWPALSFRIHAND